MHSRTRAADNDLDQIKVEPGRYGLGIAMRKPLFKHHACERPHWIFPQTGDGTGPAPTTTTTTTPPLWRRPSSVRDARITGQRSGHGRKGP